MVGLNDLECYPEVRRYTLTNLMSGTETLVTWDQLLSAFPITEINKMMTGRHDAWLVCEVLND